MCIVGGKRPVAKFVTANIIALTSKVGFLRDEKVALLFFLMDKEWRKKLNIQKPSGDSNLKLKLIQVFFDAWICIFSMLGIK